MLTNRLGILINHLSYSQLSYNIIKECNKLVDYDTIVFIKTNLKPCLNPNFAIMDMSEAWHYQAPIIATNIKLAEQLLHFISKEPKFFYIWDLEWLRRDVKPFEHWYNIYGNQELNLICRSDEHARLVENAWNREVKYIVDDFNIKQVIDIVNKVKHD